MEYKEAKRPLWVAFFSLLLVTANAIGEDTKASTYTQIKEIITSEVLGEQREITVQLPKSYDTEKTRSYPVIYRLDGASSLPLISAVLEQLQEANSAPEMIIVAIENTDRLRDLFPTKNKDPRGPIDIGGGAKHFLQFIQQELIPHVEREYRAHDYRIIAGASAAGVFSLYAMQEAPNLFQAHLAYSPAVWWNTGASANSLKSFFSETKAFDSYLYMNMGNEGGVMREIYEDMISHLKQSKPSDLVMHIEAFPGVPHGLTSTAGIFNAYHNLFLPMQMPSAKFTGEVESIENYYKRLSHQRGTEVIPPEWAVRQLGYGLVELKDFETANRVFSYNIELHPNSADAHNGLAYGLESANKLAESLKQVETAIALSKEGDSGYDVYIGRRERLLSQLNK